MFGLGIRVLHKVGMLEIIEGDQDSLILIGLILVNVITIEVVLLFAEFIKLRVHILGQNSLDFLQFNIFLLDQFESLCFLGLIKTDAGCLFNETEDFLGLHIDNFSDTALHNEKVRIIYVELN